MVQELLDGKEANEANGFGHLKVRVVGDASGRRWSQDLATWSDEGRRVGHHRGIGFFDHCREARSALGRVEGTFDGMTDLG